MLKIKALLSRLVQSLTVVEYNSGQVSWSGGTIGTRGSQVTVSVSKTGYTPIAVSISYVSSSTTFMPVAFFSSDRASVYMNFYRCTTGSYQSSGDAMRVIVHYRAN